MGGSRTDGAHYLWHSTLDQLIPYRVAPALRDDWCSQGTQVKLVTDRLSEHISGGMVRRPRAHEVADGSLRRQARHGCVLTAPP